ncbi:MAG: TldD/PmbA family protein, partial [Candidatus Hydrothermarchaeaceae archaeon]
IILAMAGLEKILEMPARFVDVIVQRSAVNSIVMKDGVIKEVSAGEVEGIGVRILENTWGFASANSLEDVLGAAKRAHRAAKLGKKIEFGEVKAIIDDVRVRPKIDPQDVGFEEKCEVLRKAFDAASECKEVVSSTFSYVDANTGTQYMNSEGSRINAEYVRVGFFASVFAKKDGQVQVGMERVGGMGGLEVIEGSTEGARDASARAVRLLDAAGAPSGVFSVVMDPLLTGVLIHEALGHAVEADHVIQKESILEDKLNESIASEFVNVYDDPTIEGSFGFYFYDSEGTKARKKAVLEGGVLKEYLHSRETASELNMDGTGNARSQSFSHAPVVRMSNTYLAPGDSEFDEMLEDVKYGVYLKGSKGGEVDTARGVFQFSAEEGFLIENGELTKPLKDVSLSGETLEILKNIDAVGRDFDMHIGFCGKASQTVPVGDGGPHIRTLATVGGQNGA